MNEKQLQKEVLSFLNSIGAYSFKTITSNRKGIPDIVGCVKGKAFYIELKGAGKINNLTVLQSIELNKATNSGALAFASDNLTDIIEKITKLSN